MSLQTLAQIAAVFASTSLLAVGGANTVLPEIHRQVVGSHGWLTDAQFTQAFALAQAAPGPNLIFVSLIGWQVGGWAGALVALVAICLPSSALTFAVAHAWHRFRDAPWRAPLQAGLAPIVAGLVLASGGILARSAATSVPALALTAIAALATLRGKVSPLALIGVAAVAGAAGWV